MENNRRRMCRRFLSCLLAACIAVAGLLTGPVRARAETVPARGLTLHRSIPARLRGKINPLQGTTEAVTCEVTQWTLSEEAAATGVQFMYTIAVLDGTNPPENGYPVADVLYQSPITADTTFSYTFYESGNYDYILFVDPVTESGAFGLYMYYIVHVTEGSGANLLMNKVAQVAAECLQGDNSDFAVALKIHDWLCDNVIYDRSESYYSAEAALLEGTGVCSAYTRAFELIAKACGLEVYRACGTAGSEGHTWNTVKMNGNWYHIDATWDDNHNERSYLWFGLTDGLIQEDHNLEYYAQGKSCTCNKMECNYYIHEAKINEYYFSSGFEDPMYMRYPERIQSYFDKGNTQCEREADLTAYILEDGNYEWAEDFRWPLMRAILEEELPKQPFTLQGVPIRVSILLTDDGLMTVRVTGWEMEETGTLQMPEDLEQIGDGAFEETEATTIVINDGCSKIGSRAFANSAVRTIVIPGSVRTIAEDAFDECGAILMIAEEGTDAAAYADENGIARIEP